jgi:hypothetical protein
MSMKSILNVDIKIETRNLFKIPDTNTNDKI